MSDFFLIIDKKVIGSVTFHPNTGEWKVMRNGRDWLEPTRDLAIKSLYLGKPLADVVLTKLESLDVA